MKLLQIDDPREVLPISCRLLKLFGLGRDAKFKWLFWLQCAIFVTFNIVTRFMVEIDSTITLVRIGSEILFVLAMLCQILASHARRTNVYQLIDMLRKLTSKPYSDDIDAHFLRRNVAMNAFAIAYCRYFIMLGVVYLTVPPVASAVVYFRNRFNVSEEPEEYVILSEMNFYNLDIRFNLLHYSIYLFFLSLLTTTAVLSLCTKGVVDFTAIRFTGVMFEVLAMQIRELPRQISQPELNKIIGSHRAVLQCSKKLEQALSLTLFIQLAFFNAIWCFILLYLILRGFNTEIIGVCIFLLVETSETFCYCWLCTELTTKSTNVQMALQQLPWYEQSVKIQKQVLLMIRCSQVPTEIKAGKLIHVNIALFSAMMQKSYSLYLVLKDLL